jgi:hypothetical protein
MTDGSVWLAPGETLWAATLEGTEWALRYLGDDGTMWSLDLVRNGEALGRPPVGWYHDRSTFVTNGAERDPRIPRTVLDAFYEPLKASAGTMNLDGFTLHRQVIDALAKETSVEEWVPGKVLRHRLGAMPKATVESIVAALRPRFLHRQQTGDQLDSYALTLAGLLASNRTTLASKIVDGAVKLFQNGYQADPRFAEFAWKDIANVASDDLRFAWAVIRAAGLMGNGQMLGNGAVFGIPRDIEDVARCNDFSGFLDYLRSGRSGRVSPTAPLRILSPPSLPPPEPGSSPRFPEQGVLIAYSWDDPDHRLWVRRFAERLRKDGVPVILDQFHLRLGDEMTQFMEQAVTRARHILIICTAKYKEKADRREGGAGYEGSIITSERVTRDPKRAFIPVLRGPEGLDAIPIWAKGIFAADMRGDPYSDDTYQDLLKRLRE